MLILTGSLLLSMLGCPTEPPSGAGADGAASPNGAPPNGDPGAGGAPPSGGGMAGLTVDLSAMKPQTSQDDLKAGEHVTLSGTVTGDCAGVVAIHAIATGGAPSTGPLTALDTVVGAYTLAVPKDTPIRLIPHCDGNKDGKITVGADGDLLAAPIDVAAVSADKAGVDIDLSASDTPPPPSSPPTGGEAPPPGGEATGGVPPGGAPPAGGAPAPGGAPGGSPPPGSEGKADEGKAAKAPN